MVYHRDARNTAIMTSLPTLPAGLLQYQNEDNMMMNITFPCHTCAMSFDIVNFSEEVIFYLRNVKMVK